GARHLLAPVRLTAAESVSAAGGGRARLILGLTALAALAVALRFLPVSAWLVDLNELFGHLGLWGIGLFAIVYALAAVLFVPGSALTIGAGVLYGLGWGCVAVPSGCARGSTAASRAR